MSDMCPTLCIHQVKVHGEIWRVIKLFCTMSGFFGFFMIYGVVLPSTIHTPDDRSHDFVFVKTIVLNRNSLVEMDLDHMLISV
jgi:hypothetical protein